MSDREELLGISNEEIEEDESNVEFEFPLKNVVADDNDENDRKVTIDEYLIKTGECGRFQIIMVVLMGIAMIPMSFPPLIFYFIGNDPAWSCKQNVTHQNGTFCSSHNSSLIFKHTSSERCELDREEWYYANHGRSTLVTEVRLLIFIFSSHKISRAKHLQNYYQNSTNLFNSVFLFFSLIWSVKVHG